MISLNKLSRYAGAGYLIIFITGIFSNFVVVEGLRVPGDASQTVENIVENPTLFRIGFISFFIMVFIDLLLAWSFYVLLKPVNKGLSLLTGWLRLVNAAIFGFALLYLVKVIQILNGQEYLSSFNTFQINSLVMMNLDSFSYAWLIGLVFFGFHLIFLGYLIFKSDYIPKFLGILLVIAGLGYLIDSFANFLLPDYMEYKDVFAIVVIVPGVIGELAFTLWLLIIGVRLKSNF